MVRSRNSESRKKIPVSRRGYFPYLLILPSLVVILGVGMGPFVYNIWLSVVNVEFNKPWIPLRHIGEANYQSVMQSLQTINALKVSLIFTAAAVAIEFFLGLFLAVLMQKNIRGKGIFRTILIVPMLMTPVIVGLSWKLLLFPQLGLLSYYGSVVAEKVNIQLPVWISDPIWALPTVIAIDVWHWTPFVFIILLAGLAAIPPEPVEAARVDGASRWRIFWTVTMPLLRPMILICVLIRTMDAYRVFDEIYILTKGGPGFMTETMSVYLHRISFYLFRMSQGAAIALLTLIIMILICYAFVRTLRRGAMLIR